MKLAITSASFSRTNKLVSLLRSQWEGDIKLNTSGARYTEEGLVEYLQDVDAAIIGLDIISKEILDRLPNLKFISKYGVGLDNIDIIACEERNIKIGWTGGVNKLSVAEMTIGFALGLSRNLYQSSINLKKNKWIKDGGFLLSGKTFGLIGFGHVGKEVFRLLKPFNCKILVNDTDPEVFDNYSFTSTSKEEIYTACDVISIHIPLTESTKSLISKKEFARMTKHPVIINTARGGIVNEYEIINALSEGKVRAFAIDAYQTEPTPPMELISRNDVFCTPHIGGNAQEAVEEMGRTAIINLLGIIG